MHLRKALFLAMFMAGVPSLRADVVIVADSQTTLPVASVQSIAWTGDFSTGNLLVNYTDGQQLSVPFSQIRQLTFAPDAQVEPEEPEGPDVPEVPDTPDTPDAIQSASADGVRVSVSGNYLLFSAMPAQGQIAVYDAAGHRVARLAPATCISLHALPAGTYVVRVGGRSVKFNKR